MLKQAKGGVDVVRPSMSPTTAEAVWILAERPAREHIAQLYSGDVSLLESLRIFTGHGLSRGESVILLVTAPHRDALLRLLRADGFDVDQAQHDGRLVILDAARALAGFIRNGMPDVALFRTQIGSVIERVWSNLGHQSLRVFGEMVDLLWKSNLAAAIRLERMWNDLIEEFDLSPFCAYSTTHAHDRSRRRSVRRTHTSSPRPWPTHPTTPSSVTLSIDESSAGTEAPNACMGIAQRKRSANPARS